MRVSFRTILPASCLSLFWLGLVHAAEPAPVPSGAAGLAGSWWEETREGGYFVSFLPQGVFQFHMVQKSPPFELPPDLMSHGKWRLQGGTVVLTEMVHEKFSEGPPESAGRVDLRGDAVVLTDVQTGETMRGKRSAWTPDPIPAAAVRRDYNQTVTGAGRIDLVPEKPEGRPGERIAVRVTLTSTDPRSMFVPLRLADRVVLLADPMPDASVGEAVIRLEPGRGSGPEVPPRILSVPLAPGGTASFVCTLIVPQPAGRLQLRADVPGNPRVLSPGVVFRVLPGAAR
jgi:hypothetical protein